MKVKKAFCLFEQSGTFKNAFKAIGVDAYDYDVLNDFGQTDFQIDLFDQIEKAYSGAGSIFDEMQGGVVMAFFPCTYFSQYNFALKRYDNRNYRGHDNRFVTERIIERHKNTFVFMEKLLQLFQIAHEKDLKLCVENPYSKYFSFLYQYRPFEPQFIDGNRMDMGDYFEKPTQFYFVNIEAGEKPLFCSARPSKKLSIDNINKNKWERSRISPEYAKNFIKYILQIENNNKE